jgi:hypothetical protein
LASILLEKEIWTQNSSPPVSYCAASANYGSIEQISGAALEMARLQGDILSAIYFKLLSDGHVRGRFDIDLFR